MSDHARLLFVVAFAAILSSVLVGSSQTTNHRLKVDIPTTWDDEAMRSFEVPLANPAASPRHVTSDYYYRIPVRPIFKSYPVYHPDREPKGYFDSLATLEPEIAFDASKLETEADWIRAGEVVFDAPIDLLSDEPLNALVRTRDWYAKNGVPVTRDGVLPFMRYVVREKGKVELGFFACGQCHTRVMPDGGIIKGAQGNFPDDRAFAYETRLEYAKAKPTDRDAVARDFRSDMYRFYAAPWLNPDPNAWTGRMAFDDLLAALEAIPPGVCARQGTSVFYPARIPDLIGLADRKYFDATGHVRHRTIADLMRYAAVNQGGDELATYAGFRPAGELPDPSTKSRYSDEQLYALALYLYSLEPPPNPHPFDAVAARGKKVFEREGCVACHTPPLYTNNALTLASGFTVPEDHDPTLTILPISVGTDARLAMSSRRGTGYYKVPTLRGVWYRGPFTHNGSIASLEDWFDPRRLTGTYVPTGFRGAGVRTQAVKGHEFGLRLSRADRKALVAFLRTL